MLSYIARRILLMIPTLFGILFVSFVIVQFAPGGPVERVIAQLQGLDNGGSQLAAAARMPVLPRARSSGRKARNTAVPRGSIRSSWRT